jgi:hypothetical protein
MFYAQIPLQKPAKELPKLEQTVIAKSRFLL